jgi:CheY-like chemotaxis protein
MMETENPILLLEDDIIDQMAVQRAFKELKITKKLIIVNNGEEALEFLKNKKNKRPRIILLDLNMPRMNGIEFLGIVKKDKDLKKIPVVVLTTSKEENDKMESFNLGIAGYIVKPVDYHNFLEAVRAIDVYWSLSELPFLK